MAEVETLAAVEAAKVIDYVESLLIPRSKTEEVPALFEQAVHEPATSSTHGPLLRFLGVSVSEILAVEIGAGSAKLSFEMKVKGFDVLPID